MNEHPNAAARDPATVAVIGGGPAGLIAAEILSAAGCLVNLYERMPSVGRKLLMAGRGGLNLTHSEPLESFLSRYREARARLEPLIQAFPPDVLRAWAEGLGQETFVGSSGRVFPKAFKTSPLLRAWLARLERQGVRINVRSDWQGWEDDGRLLIRAPGEIVSVASDATILALGGASWPKLGSNGAWVEHLAGRGVKIVPLRPANCGFTVEWSETFRGRFAGSPLKTIALSFAGRIVRGEAIVAGYGLEGGAIYSLSAALREAIAGKGRAEINVDLRPDSTADALAARLGKARKGESVSNSLRKAAGLPPVAIALLREGAGVALPREPQELATLIKAVPLTLRASAPLERAISTAGGIALSELDSGLMLKKLPGTFAAGEMLDWEAPTGGYLLQASFASGVAAAEGALRWLASGQSARQTY